MLDDFNVDYNNSSHPLFANLCTNIVNSFSLTQVVPSNTHFSPSGAGSLIDLAFISCQSSLYSCSTIPPLGTSDHYGFELALKWKLPNVSKTQPRTIWRYDHADFQTANELLETVDWESLIVDDIDVAWQNWETKFMSIMDQCVPKTTLPAKRTYHGYQKSLPTC